MSAADDSLAPARQASLFLWRGRALVVGPGIDSKFHAHFAAQLTIGLTRSFRARLSDDAPWVETRAALFAPNQSHQIDCGGECLAHLFVELPLMEWSGIDPLSPPYLALPNFEAVRTSLASASGATANLEQAEQIVHDWLACALPSVLAPAGIDKRIAAAIELINAHAGDEPNGAQLASVACLSESRFTRLFRQQTGLPLTRYLLWTRLLAGVEAVARGDNTTAAAHSAGFADLAHMSRTFRQTFGVVPSELQKMTIAFKRDG